MCCMLSNYEQECLRFEFRLFVFFFQAEDGIRDYKVTGVQTCASDLPATLVALVSLQPGECTGQNSRFTPYFRISCECAMAWPPFDHRNNLFHDPACLRMCGVK